MTLARILLNPLTLIAIIALMAWLALGQYQRANEEARERARAEAAAEKVGEYLTMEREQTIRLTESIEALADVTGTTCVDTNGGQLLPDLLRRQRTNP